MSSNEVLERRFASIGARVRVAGDLLRGVPTIDVVPGRRGEEFVLRFPGGAPVDVEVVDVAPSDRHLLLLVRDGNEKSKFLCGHDERHWFVAAVPEGARGVSSVRKAKVALQPELVQDIVERTRPKDPHRRRNAAFVRQGEWFFVPAPVIEPTEAHILRNEPLTRGGTPHVLEFAFRRGGDLVYVSRQYPGGISRAAYERLSERERRKPGWSQFVRDPELYAKGAVRHPDHATIVLHDWHRVAMNTEQGARAMRHVAFLD